MTMNERINLPGLIAMLAAKAGCQPTIARRYLHNFFSIIESELTKGNSVTVEGVGEFHPTGNTAEPVQFIPDEALAEFANQPFSAFEPVELFDDVTEEELAGVEAPQPEPEPEPVAETEPVAEAEPVAETESVAEAEPEPQQQQAPESQPEPEPQPKPQPEPEAQPLPEPEPQPETEPEEEEYYPTEIASGRSSNHLLWLVVGLLIGLIIGLVGGYFAGKALAEIALPEETAITETTDENVTEAETAETQAVVNEVQTATAEAAAPAANPEPAVTVAEAPQPAKQPVYDTVTRTRFLTTMAAEHYGRKNYWIFIYEANPNLGNPNKIGPGTKVLIPAKEDFQESTTAATDAKAQRLLNQLSRKYKL